MTTLAAVGLSPGSNVEAISGWSVGARLKARARSRESAQVAMKGWWTFLDAQLGLGAGALHRLTKRIVIPLPLRCAPRDSLPSTRKTWLTRSARNGAGYCLNLQA